MGSLKERNSEVYAERLNIGWGCIFGIQHCKVLTMAYNVCMQSSFVRPCPASIDFLNTKTPRFVSGSASVCKREAPKLFKPLHLAILDYWVPQKHSALPFVCDQLGYCDYSVAWFERVRSEILLRQLH
jgi:hypothetical protein